MKIVTPLTRALASRWTQFVALPLLVLAWFAWSDPSRGAADTLLRVQIWAQAILITGVAYLVARSLAGNVRGERLAGLAEQGSIAAGAAFAGLCVMRGLVLLGLLLFFSGSVRAQPVPDAALRLLPELRAQVDQAWPDMPTPAYFGALIEHESCITLRHPRCWSATSRLKTAREEGAGLGQLTRAWRTDGSLRFDALAQVRQLDPRGLAELSWPTVYQRPDLQMRAIVISSRATYRRLVPLVPTHAPRLAMADAAYNGGLGGLLNERRACAIQPGCDPDQWFGHVERTCLKSRAALYAGRSACDINRQHVADVLLQRMPRYAPLLPAAAGHS
ncbi:MAG: hypothetical protein ACOZJX_05280 [Pseudomonadota bacterium]